MIQKLQGLLESERESCSSVSEQRLRLQQENERLQEEADGLRRVALEAQKKAKVQVIQSSRLGRRCPRQSNRGTKRTPRGSN